MAARGDRTNVDTFTDKLMANFRGPTADKVDKCAETTDVDKRMPGRDVQTFGKENETPGKCGSTLDDVYKNILTVDNMLIFNFGQCSGTSIGNIFTTSLLTG